MGKFANPQTCALALRIRQAKKQAKNDASGFPRTKATALRQAGAGRQRTVLSAFPPVRISSPRQGKKAGKNACLLGGCGGIRTPVGVNPNGFQDRLVMTASIRIRIY